MSALPDPLRSNPFSSRTSSCLLPGTAISENVHHLARALETGISPARDTNAKVEPRSYAGVTSCSIEELDAFVKTGEIGTTHGVSQARLVFTGDVSILSRPVLPSTREEHEALEFKISSKLRAGTDAALSVFQLSAPTQRDIDAVQSVIKYLDSLMIQTTDKETYEALNHLYREIPSSLPISLGGSEPREVETEIAKAGLEHLNLTRSLSLDWIAQGMALARVRTGFYILLGNTGSPSTQADSPQGHAFLLGSTTPFRIFAEDIVGVAPRLGEAERTLASKIKELAAHHATPSRASSPLGSLRLPAVPGGRSRHRTSDA